MKTIVEKFIAESNIDAQQQAQLRGMIAARAYLKKQAGVELQKKSSAQSKSGRYIKPA
jgi:hypothetical protein